MLTCACIFSGEGQTKKEKTAAQWKSAVNDPTAAHLARPTKVQYNWQEMERAMFIQLDPATIQQGEYDNGTTKMEDIKFEKPEAYTTAQKQTLYLMVAMMAVVLVFPLLKLLTSLSSQLLSKRVC